MCLFNVSFLANSFWQTVQGILTLSLLVRLAIGSMLSSVINSVSILLLGFLLGAGLEVANEMNQRN